MFPASQKQHKKAIAFGSPDSNFVKILIVVGLFRHVVEIKDKGGTGALIAHDEHLRHLCASFFPGFDGFFFEYEVSPLGLEGFREQALGFGFPLGSVDICLGLLFGFLGDVDSPLRPLFGDLFFFDGAGKFCGEV